MPNKLYVVHGSHPCACVERALELKGIAYKRVELPPPLHAAIARVRFGARTVPALQMADGEKISGSRAIMRRLDELVPEPAMLPSDPALRTRVLEAEQWGDDVLQPLARTIIWPVLARNPKAISSFQEHSSLPSLPAPVVAAGAPMITGVEKRLNSTSADAARHAIAELPAHLDKIDAWLAEGVLGGDEPNAADLQIAPSLRVLSTIADLRPLLDARPCGAWSARMFPVWDGDVPAGGVPADWVAAAA